MAFLSLGAQVELLIGSRGLLPAAETLEFVSARGLGFLKAPSIFLFVEPTDLRLVAGCVFGLGLALAALFGFLPRLCFALLGILYLSYITLCRSFLHFQWDSLLIESAFLAVFLPRDRSRRWVHLLLTFVLFKVYFESGIAKIGSPSGDWRDGSAMSLYYETAPLPTALAWYAHQLPYGWHALESRVVLVAELALPFFAFGPRGLRLFAFACLSLFLGVNFATANYGFFLPLCFCLQLFLLNDEDLARVRARLPRFLGGGTIEREVEVYPSRWSWRRSCLLGLALVPLQLGLSWGQFSLRFMDEPVRWLRHEPAASLFDWNSRLLVVNTYHLFAQVTQHRIEPDVQVFHSGSWESLSFRYKPGPVDRAPPFVAPHQPRVDFRLWFYGLGFQRETPGYVLTLIERLCTDPEAVQDLFSSPLPAQPEAVRLVFWDYRFSTSEERAAGLWWNRAEIGGSDRMPCPAVDPGSGGTSATNTGL